MARARTSAASRWTSLGTSIDGFSFYLAGLMAVALAAYGMQGAIRSHLEGRRFIAASSQEQLMMMRWGDEGPFFGNPASPSLRCVNGELQGTHSIPVDFVRNDSALCDAAVHAFTMTGREAGLSVSAPGPDLASSADGLHAVRSEAGELCRIDGEERAVPALGMTIGEFRDAAPACARRMAVPAG